MTYDSAKLRGKTDCSKSVNEGARILGDEASRVLGDNV